MRLGDIMEDYLIHFGVKGMKWGVRKDSKEYQEKKMLKKAKRTAFINQLKPFANKQRSADKGFNVIAEKISKDNPKAGALNSFLIAANTPKYKDAINKSVRNAQNLKRAAKGAALIGTLGFIGTAYVNDINRAANIMRDEYDRNKVGSSLKSGNFGDAVNSIGNSRAAENIRNGTFDINEYKQNYDAAQTGKQYLDELLGRKK